MNSLVNSPPDSAQESERYDAHQNESSIRNAALRSAVANSALSGFHPTDFALQLYGQWIKGSVSMQAAIEAMKLFHRSLEATEPSDGLAPSNLIGITDSRRMA